MTLVTVLHRDRRPSAVRRLSQGGGDAPLRDQPQRQRHVPLAHHHLQEPHLWKGHQLRKDRQPSPSVIPAFRLRNEDTNISITKTSMTYSFAVDVAVAVTQLMKISRLEQLESVPGFYSLSFHSPNIRKWRI